MSWFDKVTGSNDYERQSWRDNFNGGKAAGDWTGGVNAKLDQERSDFGGATWSGSSAEYSALEYAQRQATPAQLAELRGSAPGAPKTAVSGLTQDGVVEAPVSAVARGAAKGQAVASILRLSAASGGSKGMLGNSLAYKPMDWVLEGYDVKANPHTSNAEDLETRYGDLVSAVAGVGIVGSDIGHNMARAYFGDDYTKLSPGQRVSILTRDADSAIRENAIGAFFGGWDAMSNYATAENQRNASAKRAAAEVDAAWDYRLEQQAIEGLKAGVGSRMGGF